MDIKLRLKLKAFDRRRIPKYPKEMKCQTWRASGIWTTVLDSPFFCRSTRPVQWCYQQAQLQVWWSAAPSTQRILTGLITFSSFSIFIEFFCWNLNFLCFFRFSFWKLCWCLKNDVSLPDLKLIYGNVYHLFVNFLSFH